MKSSRDTHTEKEKEKKRGGAKLGKWNASRPRFIYTEWYRDLGVMDLI